MYLTNFTQQSNNYVKGVKNMNTLYRAHRRAGIEGSRAAADEAVADEILRAVRVIAADETYASQFASPENTNRDYAVRFAYEASPGDGKKTVIIGTVNENGVFAADDAETATGAKKALADGFAEFLGADWEYGHNVKSHTYRSRPYTIRIDREPGAADARAKYTITGAWADPPTA
jgi:hypothetical protein